MAWSVPAGPVALMVFYGEGRLSSAIAGKDLFEDDLLSWEVDAGTTLYATGEEGILAYVWGWPEDSGLPGLADANPFQVRWGDVQPFETGEDAPRARSLLVVEGVDGDDGSVSKTWKVAAGDILHPDAIGVPAVCRSEGRLTLVGLWENTRHGSGSRLRFGPVTIGSGQRG